MLSVTRRYGRATATLLLRTPPPEQLGDGIALAAVHPRCRRLLRRQRGVERIRKARVQRRVNRPFGGTSTCL